jgi:hypothetical protein
MSLGIYQRRTLTALIRRAINLKLRRDGRTARLLTAVGTRVNQVILVYVVLTNDECER